MTQDISKQEPKLKKGTKIVDVGYSMCKFISIGLGDQTCPMCNAVVPDGVLHECGKGKSK